MATTSFIKIAKQILLCALLINFVSARRILTSSSQENKTMLFQYHNGTLLIGNVSINLIWYGKFESSQKAIIFDFITSLSSTESQAPPSVATWWKTIEKYYNGTQFSKPSLPNLSLGSQILDEEYSLGKTLKTSQIENLASDIGDQVNAINVILTSSDVAVDGFCYSKCGYHGSNELPYIWVGNSDTQCLGFCGWPFKQPIYGPQTPPLFAPNDVGLDAMVVQLASLLAGTVTNPFGNGYYQGPAGAPLEAASACPGIFAKGAYPGYAGDLLVDASTGASYNANGVNGRKYLLPALYDPSTQSCTTLV